MLLANNIKSKLSFILIEFISGCAMTTPLFPPNFSNLASMSPKLRVTDNLPGRTLWGLIILLSNKQFILYLRGSYDRLFNIMLGLWSLLIQYYIIN